MTQLIQIQNPAQLVDIIQNLTTGSFERKFADVPTFDVVTAFAFATKGLNHDQLLIGLDKLLEMGYCPDPALFRRWCLGHTTFDNTDAVADSYVGKNGALANILRWLVDDSTPITIAQKQAYDATYHMFNEIEYASSGDFAKTQAYSAFKDTYEHIVRELIANRQACQPYTPPMALEQAMQSAQPKTTPASAEFVNDLFAKLKAVNKIERPS